MAKPARASPRGMARLQRARASATEEAGGFGSGGFGGTGAFAAMPSRRSASTRARAKASSHSAVPAGAIPAR